MKDKIVKTNITKFDKNARILGILGTIMIVFTLAFCIPMISSITTQNEILTKEVSKNNGSVSNLQFQIEHGDNA